MIILKVALTLIIISLPLGMYFGRMREPFKTTWIDYLVVILALTLLLGIGLLIIAGVLAIWGAL